MNQPKLFVPSFYFIITNCLATFFIFLFSSPTASGQIISVSSSGSQFSTDASVGTIPFTAPANAAVVDDKFAAASALVEVGKMQTHYLTAKGFNFNVPNSAVITGVAVVIQEKAAGLKLLASVTDHQVKLIKNNVIAGNNKAKNISWPGNAINSAYGSNADMWGLSLTPQDVNKADFGVAISAEITSLASVVPSIEIGAIDMTVYYKLVTPLPVIYKDFKTLLQQNEVLHQWTMAEEETGGKIILQQLYNNTWTDVKTYDKLSNSTNQQYTYKHTVWSKGMYQFRLKLMAASGAVSYSIINSVHCHEAGMLLYPTVANSTIHVTNIPAGAQVAIFNSSNQLMVRSTIVQSEGSMVISVGHLPKGLYFLKAGLHVKKFYKL